MTAHRNRSASVAGAVVLAFALASCTANTNDPTPTPSGSATAPTPTDELPPIEALQLEIVGTVDDDAWARIENDRFETAVAACMQAAGFEYTPEEFVPEEADADTETLAWAREFGYGITTYADDEDEEDEDVEPTPNDLYISGLSDEELDAYWIAFEGEVSDDEGGGFDLGDLDDLDEDGDGEIDLGDLEFDEDGEIDLGDLDEDEFSDEDFLDEDFDLDESGYGGCQGEAYDALAENPLPYDQPEHVELLTLLDAMYADIAVDDLLAEAEESWIACMDAAGYPDLASADDAQYLVFDAYDAAWEQVPEDAEDIDPALIEPVRELELAVATADFECRESSGLDKAYTEAQHAAETEFIAEHREGLVAFFEDMGAALQN